MPTILECPHCESRFQIEVVKPRVDCPRCKINFKPNVASVAQTPGSLTPRSTGGIKAPRRLQTESRVAAPTPKPKPRTAAPPPLLPPTNHEPTSTQAAPDLTAAPTSGSIGIASKPQTYSKRRKKKSPWWLTLLTIVLATVAVGGLYAIVTTLGKPDPELAENLDDAEKVNSKTAASNDGATDKGEGAFDTAAKKFGKDFKPKAPVVPPVDETPKFFEPRQGEIVWSKIGSYLVKLDIETPVSSHVQTGLIVDSRGWVLTSLKGLKDAGKVTVTVAAKSLKDRPPYRELSDQAHGIIATNAELDLAVIAINRIQVNNLADIAFLPKDDVVAAQQLMIARTPPPGHQRWLAECRVQRRGKPNEIDPAIKKAIDADGLKQDLRYIHFPPRIKSNYSPHIAGSPLVDTDGNVRAFNTGTMAAGNVVAIPGPVAKQFLQSIPNPAPEPKPFARQVDLVRQNAFEEVPTGSGAGDEAEQVVTPQMEYDSILRNLESAIDTARSTDWTAESDVEYQAMQKVPELILKAEQWISVNFDRRDEAESEQERLESLINQIGESLEVDLDIEEFQSGKGNEFFLKQVNENSPWFMAFVRVEKDLLNSGQLNGRDTATLQLLGTDKKLIATLADDVRSFRRNRWLLLLGRLDSRGTVSRDGSEMQIIEVLSAYELSTRQ